MNLDRTTLLEREQMSYQRKFSFYHINNFLLCEALENYSSLSELARICNIDARRLQSAKQGSVLEKSACEMLCKEIKIPFEELCTEKRKERNYEKSETYLEESEKILNGLKENIFKRLDTVGHNIYFKKQIEEVLNELIVEATYLGVNAQIQGNTEFVEKAIQKRRGR